MKKLLKHSTGLFLTLFILLIVAQSSHAASTQVDILFMNHGPMRPTVTKIKTLLTEYGDTVQAAWYDVDQQSGKTFMKKQKINGHVPMLIRINGQSEFTIGGRPVSLQGFPTGSSPFKRVEGNWSLDDLNILLDKEVRK
jgi:hypothetical protein